MKGIIGLANVEAIKTSGGKVPSSNPSRDFNISSLNCLDVRVGKLFYFFYFYIWYIYPLHRPISVIFIFSLI